VGGLHATLVDLVYGVEARGGSPVGDPLLNYCCLSLIYWRFAFFAAVDFPWIFGLG